MVLAVAHDLPVGAVLDGSSVRPVRAALGGGQAALVIGAGEVRAIAGMRTRHELAGGQLLQRSDVEPEGLGAGGGVLVVLPMKDLPPVHQGDLLDVFALSGNGDRTVAQPFAWSVPVESAGGGSVVVRVRRGQELAFVYAAGSMRLAAAVSRGPQPPGGAAPITSAEQAVAVAAR